MTIRGWLESFAAKEAAGDRLGTGERVGQAIGIVILVLVIAFFLTHQNEDTGFFTNAFGTLEMALFYSVLGFGLLPPTLRLIFGEKNRFKPVDIIGMALFIIAAAYFLCEFPFDFEYFADPLPGFLEWTIGWIDNGIAKIFLALGLIGTVIGMGFTALSYLLVRERRRLGR